MFRIPHRTINSAKYIIRQKACLRILILSSTAFYGLCNSQHARAQSVTQHKAHAPSSSATPAATAAKAPAADTPPPAPKPEIIHVSKGTPSSNGVTNTTPGGGLMARQTVAKSQSTITRDFIAKQSPTANPIALVTNLPGVVSSGNDPLGQSTTSISMRGLNQTEIGFLYEGMPLADSINYTPYTQSVVDSDNISSVTIDQGAPDISAPVYNDVGGLMKISLRHAADKMGGRADFSFGSKSLEREFIRLDSGDIAHTGIKAFASFSSTSNNEWRGSGQFRKYHVDAEIRKDWTPETSLAFIFSYDNWQQSNYRPMTLAAWKQYGINYNYNKDYTVGDQNWTGLNNYERRSMMMMLPFKTKFAKGLSFNFTPAYSKFDEFYLGAHTLSTGTNYYGTQAVNNLQGLGASYNNGATTMAEQINPVPQQSFFLNTGLTWKKGINTLQFGYSYNYIDLLEQIWYTGVAANGGMRNVEGKYPVTLSDGTRFMSLDQHFQHQMNSLYISDTVKLLNDRLTINAGLKYIMINRTMVNNTPGAIRDAGGSYSQPLPQFSASYMMTKHDQIFIDGTTAYRAPASVEAYGQLWTPSSGAAASNFKNMAGEYSIGEELGYRHYGLVNVSLSLFNYNITNNQVQTYVTIGSMNVPEPVQNGGKTSRGAQIEIGLRPWHHFSPYASAQYLHATMDNNYVAQDAAGRNVVLPTKGKVAVMSPELVAAVGLAYDNGRYFGNFSFNYVGSQYSTFMNDEKIPGYEQANMTLGYRLHDVGFAKRPQFQLNVMNLGAKNYLSGIQSATATSKGYGTVAGHAPVYYVSGGVAVTASLSTGF